MKKITLSIAVAVFIATHSSAQAAVTVSEVAPWSSGNSPVAADWFELTNTGTSIVNISGWKFDDNSNSFASAANLLGVSNIDAGQSVIFVEGTVATANNFVSNWFGSNVPVNFAIGYYSGAGLGLGNGGDAVNIFNASGVNQASVSFGAADTTSPFQTFDNSAGLTGTISALSVIGVNGAFIAANSSIEIGSPGTIAAIPEPDTYALLVAGLGLVGFASRKRKG